jgi:hypothetical protein
MGCDPLGMEKFAPNVECSNGDKRRLVTYAFS